MKKNFMFSFLALAGLLFGLGDVFAMLPTAPTTSGAVDTVVRVRACGFRNRCLNYYPVREAVDNSAYQTYEKCILGQGEKGKFKCALNWAVDKGLKLCNDDADCTKNTVVKKKMVVRVSRKKFAKKRTCTPYLNDYLSVNRENNREEVEKLQMFLKNYEGETNLATTGVFDQDTLQAVVRFQEKYASEVLTPWGLKTGTGNVLKTTTAQINKLWCAKNN